MLWVFIRFNYSDSDPQVLNSTSVDHAHQWGGGSLYSVNSIYIEPSHLKLLFPLFVSDILKSMVKFKVPG